MKTIDRVGESAELPALFALFVVNRLPIYAYLFCTLMSECILCQSV